MNIIGRGGGDDSDDEDDGDGDEKKVLGGKALIAYGRLHPALPIFFPNLVLPPTSIPTPDSRSLSVVLTTTLSIYPSPTRSFLQLDVQQIRRTAGRLRHHRLTVLWPRSPISLTLPFVDKLPRHPDVICRLQTSSHHGRERTRTVDAVCSEGRHWQVLRDSGLRRGRGR